MPTPSRRVRTFSADPLVVKTALEQQRKRNIQYAAALSRRLAKRATAFTLAAEEATKAASLASLRVMELMDNPKAVDPEATADERAFDDEVLSRLERYDPHKRTVEDEVRRLEKKRLALVGERDEPGRALTTEEEEEEEDDNSPFPCENDYGTGFFGVNGQEYLYSELVGYKVNMAEDGKEEEIEEIEYEY
ncbi:hypothetical protein CPC08DRAFT_766956 [Agrocybe pediades]|nr:hypothetical protein CPC08DRAFT_766956 [Agrocybe pediades]